MHADEVAAQAQLLSAIVGRDAVLPSGSRALHTDSLQAYRGSFAANTERALAVMYPQIAAFLGEEDFAQLARLYALAHPPTRGDLAQYGWQFSDWLRVKNPAGITQALPWLPDGAALALALFQSEMAAELPFDADSLSLLAADAAAHRIVLQPHLHCLSLQFDVIDFDARAADDAIVEPEQSVPYDVMVSRSGWRASTQAVPADHAAFIRACLAEQSFAEAVHAAQAALAAQTPDAEFDLTLLLQQALSAQWLACVSPVSADVTHLSQGENHV